MSSNKSPSINQQHPVWGLAGTVIWGLIIAVIFVITQLAVIGVYIGINFGEVAPSEYETLVTNLQFDGFVISISTITTLLVCGSLILCVIKLKKNSDLKHYLGLRTVGLKTLWHWLLIIIALIIVSDLLTFLLGKPIVPDFVTTMYQSMESPWLLWLALVVAAPLFEELFFRGFLIPGISSSFLGSAGAIIISSASWAAIHLQYDIYNIATIFVIGIALGVARIKSGSVLLTIGLHSFINLVATIEAVISLS